MRNINNKVTVMFSGGRDSSLATCLFALEKYNIHLIGFKTGFGIKSDVKRFRIKELKNRFQKNSIINIIIS